MPQSYQVLARKYRPKNFHELVGQTHVSKALINAIDNNRVHHAFLFTGTRGVGKTTIARILAKCLNCDTGITSTPCGVCNSCTAIDEGRFIDLIEIDAASRTKVEDTRELLDNVPYAPTQGRYKVYLIDEVHMLSTHSFNALLKTLEEPPEHVKFLLATTDPQKLPITIISRCLQFVLRPLPQQALTEHLQNILTKEQVIFADAALWQLAHAAKGSVRDCLSLTDQAIAFGQGALDESTVNQMLGLINSADIVQLIADIYQNNRVQVANQIEHMRAQMVDAGSLFDGLSEVLHQLALLQVLPSVSLNTSQQQQQVLQQLAAHMSADVIQLYYEIVIKARENMMLATTPMQALEMCLLRLLAFRPLAANEMVLHDAISSHLHDSDDNATNVNIGNHHVANIEPVIAPNLNAYDTPELVNEQIEQMESPSEASAMLVAEVESNSDSDSDSKFEAETEHDAMLADSNNDEPTHTPVQTKTPEIDTTYIEQQVQPQLSMPDDTSFMGDLFTDDDMLANEMTVNDEMLANGSNVAGSDAVSSDVVVKDDVINEMASMVVTEDSELTAFAALEASVTPIQQDQPLQHQSLHQPEHTVEPLPLDLLSGQPDTIQSATVQLGANQPVTNQLAKAQSLQENNLPEAQKKQQPDDLNTNIDIADPREQLICPPQELTGQWTVEKWDFWVQHARQQNIFDKDELALARQGMMVGDCQGASQFITHVHSHNFDAIFSNMIAHLQQHFPTASYQLQSKNMPAQQPDTTQHQDESIWQQSLPCNRQQARVQQAMLQAKQQLSASAVMQYLATLEGTQQPVITSLQLLEPKTLN